MLAGAGRDADFLMFQPGRVVACHLVAIAGNFSEARPRQGYGVSVFAMQMTNFSIAFMFPIMLDSIGLTMSFFCFAAIGVAGGIFAILFAPETQGKTLEQIEKHFKKHLQDDPAPQEARS